MAYYTGQCSSYQHLADILVEKCQAHGWTWQDSILNKDDLYLKITIENGILLTGGTGKDGLNLVNQSNYSSRLGATANFEKNIFPAIFHLFIFSNEVYLMMKFDIDKFYYLAFGKSTLLNNSNGTGLWLCATSPRQFTYTSKNTENIEIHTTHGGYYGRAVAPFWALNEFSNGRCYYSICHGLDNVLWSSESNKAYVNFAPLIDRLPTVYFSDSPLLPYNIYLERPENKISLIAQLQNARFVRVDNYEPEQIITLGHEKWIVFPFFRKNVQAKNGGYGIDHTGTFGWAIRYEG